MHIHSLDNLRQLIASPSGLVVAVALAVCSLPFVAGFALLSPAYFGTSFHRVVAKSPWDDRVFGFATAAALSTSHPTEPIMVLVGSSSMRAAFDSDIIEDELLKLTRKRSPVFKLAVSDLSIMEFIGMIEHIPAGSTGKLFVKVSPTAMTTDYLADITRLRLQNLDRFTLQSPKLVQEMKVLGIRKSSYYGNFFLDNIAFFCARYKRIAFNLLTNQAFDVEHRYVDKGKIDQAHWNMRGIQVVQVLSTYEDQKRRNFDYIHSLVDYVRSNTDMEIILVEQLLNPDLLSQYIYPSFYAQYQKDMSELANSLDVKYLDLPGLLHFDSSVFYDWTHLNSASAIKQASRQLVQSGYSESLQD